ncbi:hypothetical protein P7H75_02495 [Vagococcus carniphilus]|uniref:hypothetical protein n=1 Tax=Vagococcus carniphilus TaxID=218144 RepID=UPI002891F54A|nr:hypothetical protein [Vagococcus carniphilus]MDT2813703.1 hypothetical protein [Vagococcus carniphilus]
MLKVVLFGVLMNFFIFFEFGTGLSGINILFTIGLLGILYDFMREKKEEIKSE